MGEVFFWNSSCKVCSLMQILTSHFRFLLALLWIAVLATGVSLESDFSNSFCQFLATGSRSKVLSLLVCGEEQLNLKSTLVGFGLAHLVVMSGLHVSLIANSLKQLVYLLKLGKFRVHLLVAIGLAIVSGGRTPICFVSAIYAWQVLVGEALQRDQCILISALVCLPQIDTHWELSSLTLSWFAHLGIQLSLIPKTWPIKATVFSTVMTTPLLTLPASTSILLQILFWPLSNLLTYLVLSLPLIELVLGSNILSDGIEWLLGRSPTFLQPVKDWPFNQSEMNMLLALKIFVIHGFLAVQRLSQR